MAQAQAQRSVDTFTRLLRKRHHGTIYNSPSRRSFPGHMNVLLAEASVPYDIVLEMDEINDDFGKRTWFWLLVPTTWSTLLLKQTLVLQSPECPFSKFGNPHVQLYSNERSVGRLRRCSEPLFYKGNRMFLGDARFSKLNASLNQ